MLTYAPTRSTSFPPTEFFLFLSLPDLDSNSPLPSPSVEKDKLIYLSTAKLLLITLSWRPERTERRNSKLIICCTSPPDLIAW